MRSRRSRVLAYGLIVCFAVIALFSLRTGAVRISEREILGILWGWSKRSDATAEIILGIRLPRMVLSALVGAALALSGSVYQGLFRNPMADPYVIGASAGASLGATIAMMLPINLQLLGLGTISLFAFVGSLATVAVVFGLARTGQRTPIVNLILAGVSVSSVISAVVSLLMFLMPQEGLHGLVFWLMGGFSGRNWNHVVAVIPHFIVGMTVVLLHLKQLNAILLGEEEAMSLGVDVPKVTKRLVAAASLLTASTVAAGGIIAFAGLVVPHLVRLIVGPDHRRLVPNSCLLGAVFVLIADTIASSVIPPRALPVGIVTALTGGPFFIYLLRKHKPKE